MKKGPIILISFLALLLIFILGVQYGKSVQTSDEAIKMILSIIPTPSISSPTIPSSATYIDFNSKTCGISFVYPAELKPTIESSYSGSLLNESGNEKVLFNCEPKMSPIDTSDSKIASSSVRLGSTTVVGFQSADEETTTIQVKHPQRQNQINITYSDSIKPLLEKTFQFVK